jgi:hypothetical protein
MQFLSTANVLDLKASERIEVPFAQKTYEIAGPQAASLADYPRRRKAPDTKELPEVWDSLPVYYCGARTLRMRTRRVPLTAEEKKARRATDAKKYQQKHRDSIRVRAKEYIARHPEKAAEYAKRYQEKHHDRELARGKRYREQNPEKVKEACRRWQANNKERVLAARIAGKEAKKVDSRENYINNRTKILANQKVRLVELKLKTISLLGARCVCCGDTTFEFLTVDHTEGGGSRERKANRTAGSQLYRVLNREGCAADKYRLLCMNCNFSFGHYGNCPHDTLPPLAPVPVQPYAPRNGRSEKWRDAHPGSSEESRALSRRHYLENRDELLAWQRADIIRRKERAIARLGGQCVCCKESRYQFLTVDHIHGGGNRERLSRGSGGVHAYRMLEAEGYDPQKYRLLCMNCNFASGIYGRCPHGTLSDPQSI